MFTLTKGGNKQKLPSHNFSHTRITPSENMAAQLTIARHDSSSDGPMTKKDAMAISTENVSEVDAPPKERQHPALGPEQIRALVLDAFESASSQLHAPNEEGGTHSIPESNAKRKLTYYCAVAAVGILASILPPETDDNVKNGTAVGPRSAELVETDTRDTLRKCPQEKSAHAMEPYEAVRGSYLYLPGFGFIYQDDNSDLGSDETVS
ncbi:hypothetical protein PWT90_04766 [Aphanocladium album]|nr:hypothetical protein PWT90_04766 [Aphanocladium album]